MAVDRTHQEVAKIIDRFLDGTCGPWDWDDFVSLAIRDPELDEVRKRCGAVHDNFPPDQPGHYCNAQGVEVLHQIARELRGPDH